MRMRRLTRLLAARTRSASKPPEEQPLVNYISRDAAAGRYDGTPFDIFQGDIFRSVEVMVPQPSGAWREPVGFPVIVVAHDCEWTKYLQYGSEPAYPISIAPLRRLSAFDNDQKPGLLGTIRSNKVRYLFPLPAEPPLNDEYVVDLRLTQPITVAELLDQELWTSVGDGIKIPLRGKLIVFYADVELVKADGR